MLSTVRDACQINEWVRNYRMTEAIENLSDLIADEASGRRFFEKNYVTQGMAELFREGLLRLSGKSDQAAFELAQAMGGGKTHLMVALGLLAKHPSLRSEVLPPDIASRIDFGAARIASFNGRNNPQHYVWGEICQQLGAEDLIRPYWADGPKGVDESLWLKILSDEPTLILFDELPPYLLNANTRTVGNGTLADVVTYTLSNLLSAAIKSPRCCIVIANLSGSYQEQTKDLSKIVSNLRHETKRQAKIITPVALAGDEIYSILKKRLFAKIADATVIDAVAEAFVDSVKSAQKAGLIAVATTDDLAADIRETYPFHPSFKNILAMFKENEGFRQTRGLMQFTARLLANVWDRPTNDVFLIGTQHFNLNDPDTRDEIKRINTSLDCTIVNDIADNGSARAEKIDAAMGLNAATQVSKLILASSLSRAVNGPIGLARSEIIEFLVAPGFRSIDFDTALNELTATGSGAWYLHRESERYYFKDVENLGKRIDNDARQIPIPKIEEALIRKLTALFEIKNKNPAAYQSVLVMPRLEDINLSDERVLLVVRPDGKTPPETISNFFDDRPEKNNFLVLSGDDSHIAAEIEKSLRELYAVEKINANLKPGDTLYAEAKEKQEELDERFTRAVAVTYNRIFFPGGEGELVKATIANGLKFGNNEQSVKHQIGTNEQSVEYQIEKLLSSSLCNNKLVTNLASDVASYWSMAETYLWPIKERISPWRDIVMRAKRDPSWPWMPGEKGMDILRDEALRQGRWRRTVEGHIEKGPFPTEKTAVSISTLSTNHHTGESVLSIVPRNAGNNPKVFASNSSDVSEKDTPVINFDEFRTTDPSLYFIAIDGSGTNQTGPSTCWIADIVVKHEIRSITNERVIELKCSHPASLRYTLDGSNPRRGALYSQPFSLPALGCTIMVLAKIGDIEKETQILVPVAGDDSVNIDTNKPAKLNDSVRIFVDNTEKTFRFINGFRNKKNALMNDVKLIIGEGDKQVHVNFGSHPLNAQSIELAINGIREALNEQQADAQIIARGGMSFPDGHQLNEFVQLIGMDIKKSDVTQ
jgi:hypothetical protein